MVDRLRAAFASQLAAKAFCLQECAHAEFHVHDPHPVREGKGPCHLLTTGLRAKSDLHVRNSARRQLYFLAIDQCIYGDGDPGKCDCALISGDTIYFVEFKTSENKHDPALPKAYVSPGECLDQLAASIRDFYDRGIIPPGQRVYAYASVGFPRHRPQSGAHYTDQLNALQLKVQQDIPRAIRLRFCSESELTIN